MHLVFRFTPESWSAAAMSTGRISNYHSSQAKHWTNGVYLDGVARVKPWSEVDLEIH